MQHKKTGRIAQIKREREEEQKKSNEEKQQIIAKAEQYIQEISKAIDLCGVFTLQQKDASATYIAICARLVALQELLAQHKELSEFVAENIHALMQRLSMFISTSFNQDHIHNQLQASKDFFERFEKTYQTILNFYEVLKTLPVLSAYPDRMSFIHTRVAMVKLSIASMYFRLAQAERNETIKRKSITKAKELCTSSKEHLKALKNIKNLTRDEKAKADVDKISAYFLYYQLMASIAIEEHKPNKAHKLFSLCLYYYDHSDKHHGRMVRVSQVYHEFCHMLMETQRYEEAIEYLENGMDLHEDALRKGFDTNLFANDPKLLPSAKTMLIDAYEASNEVLKKRMLFLQQEWKICRKELYKNLYSKFLAHIKLLQFDLEFVTDDKDELLTLKYKNRNAGNILISIFQQLNVTYEHKESTLGFRLADINLEKIRTLINEKLATPVPAAATVANLTPPPNPSSTRQEEKSAKAERHTQNVILRQKEIEETVETIHQPAAIKQYSARIIWDNNKFDAFDVDTMDSGYYRLNGGKPHKITYAVIDSSVDSQVLKAMGDEVRATQMKKKILTVAGIGLVFGANSTCRQGICFFKPVTSPLNKNAPTNDKKYKCKMKFKGLGGDFRLGGYKACTGKKLVNGLATKEDVELIVFDRFEKGEEFHPGHKSK